MHQFEDGAEKCNKDFAGSCKASGFIPISGDLIKLSAKNINLLACSQDWLIQRFVSMALKMLTN
jgi:hypothetical protein